MASTLKMIFSLEDSDKTYNLSLSEPKEGLERATVETAATEIVSKNAFKKDGAFAEALKEAYIETVERTDIVA